MKSNRENRPEVSKRKINRGRAVIVGLAPDDPDGHIRLTKGDGFRLVGGTENEHSCMLQYTQKIQEELEKRNLSLANITKEQAEEISNIINDIFCEQDK